jgi:hypothetical protein
MALEEKVDVAPIDSRQILNQTMSSGGDDLHLGTQEKENEANKTLITEGGV